MNSLQRLSLAHFFLLALLFLSTNVQAQNSAEFSLKPKDAAHFELPGDGHHPNAEIRLKAEKGDVAAQFELGCFFEDWKNPDPNYEEAIKWYRKAAEQNNAEAQYRLGLRYEGTNSVEASKWLTKAAELDHVEAQLALGYRYASWTRYRWEKNDEVARKWFRKAADNELAEAQHVLGRNYLEGRGIEKDYVESLKWLQKAAEQNYYDAQNLLGFGYQDEKTFGLNYVEAYAWFNLASVSSSSNVPRDIQKVFNESAALSRDNLEERMTPEQIAAGQKRTKELRAKIDTKLKGRIPPPLSTSDSNLDPFQAQPIPEPFFGAFREITTPSQPTEHRAPAPLQGRTFRPPVLNRTLTAPVEFGQFGICLRPEFLPREPELLAGVPNLPFREAFSGNLKFINEQRQAPKCIIPALPVGSGLFPSHISKLVANFN